jgi:glycosyltransferase involved in cell wall biosynthesis
MTPVSAPIVVMSFNALTKDFRTCVEAKVGADAAYYNAANLRKMSFAAGIRDLRRIRAEKIVIAIESEVGQALLAPLSLAAALTRARSIDVIWPDLRTESLGRAKAIGRAFALVRDTLRARGSLVRSKARMAALAQEPMPRPVPAARGHSVLYLDANISLGAPVGGSVGHTAGVIGGFVARGFSVDYASIKPAPTVRSGAAWHKFEPTTLLAVPAELNYYPYAELIESKLVAMHRAAPWSFIYQRFSLHNFLGSLLGRKLDVPVVVEFNGSEAWAAERWGMRLALHDEAEAAERMAVTKADLVVTVSDALVRDLRQHGVPEERILVYPNCVDPEAFDARRFTQAELAALRDHLGIPRDAFVLGFIGTFGQWHGVDFLAECIRDLVTEDLAWLERNRLHFMLVGDGLKMEAVRRTLDSGTVRRFATLTGLVAQSEAPKYLACADVLMSPHVQNADGSEFFGSPTKLFEYMAMERPVLASALGQIADVVEGRGATQLGRLPPGAGAACGLLFEPGDAAAFKNRLRELIGNPELGRSLAQAARAEVLARYTWNRHVDAILRRMTELNLLDRG